MHNTDTAEKILLVNTDGGKPLKLDFDKKAYVVTYGLNSKATITASSIDDSHIVLCLQRGVTCLDGAEIEPQEFTVSRVGDMPPEAVMQMAAVCLLSGVPVDRLSKFVF